MSGGDAAPLNENAVHEINKVFRWAKKSPKGLILFIDEAEAFLRKGRGDLTNQGMSEDARNALSVRLFFF
jgi:ATPase family AAA domain-containing protein 3A/B